MAQQTFDDPFGLGLKPASPSRPAVDDPYGLGLKPAFQPTPLEPTWGQSIISNVIGTGPAIIGGIGGGLVGGLPGGIAGGMAGGGIGADLRQRYEISQGLRDEYNPYVTAVEAGFGAFPGVTKFPGFGTGLKELAKYTGKTAAEGALISAAATPFQQAAETGDWKPSLEQIGTSAGIGGITGGVFGLGTPYALRGMGVGATAAAPPPIDVPTTTQKPLVPPPIQLQLSPLPTQPQLPETRVPQPPYTPLAPPIEGPELGPYGAPAAREQPRLPYRGIPAPETPPSAESPIGTRGQIGDPLITIVSPSRGLTEYLRNNGYVTVQNLRDPKTGEIQMARADIASQHIGAETAPKKPFLPGAIPEGQIGIREGQDIVVPNARTDDMSFIKNMRDGGYKLMDIGPTHSTFKRFMGEEEGSFSHTEMVENLTRLLGREPTPDEVNRGMARQPGPTEQTGRVAPFASTLPRVEVFDPRDGTPIAEFRTQEEADAFITRHPEGRSLDSALKGEGYPEPQTNELTPEGETRLLEIIRAARPAEATNIRSAESNIQYWQFKLKEYENAGDWQNRNRALGEMREAEIVADRFRAGESLTPEITDQLQHLTDLTAKRTGLGPREILPGDVPTPPIEGEINPLRLIRERAGLERIGEPGTSSEEISLDVPPVRPSEASEPFARPPTYKELKALQNEAYRRGDTNEAVRLGQEMQRMDELANRLSIEDRKKFGSRITRPEHPFGSKGNYEPSELSAPELKHPTAQRWDAYMRQLDAEGAPDTAYRDIMSTGSKNALKKGETWRGRVQKAIEYFESTINSENKNFLSEATGIPPDDFIRMEVGDRVQVLRNMQGTYAEHGARVAAKELLQNAIDVTKSLTGKISVMLNYRAGAKGHSITVKDEGPGLNLDLIKNEYVTLTGSGKRGQPSITGRKSIGEMGVGKATYLLGTDSFEVKTVAVESDGSTWKYEFEGTPDAMIGEDISGNPVPPIQINKTRMPDGTPTGTEVTVYDKDRNNIQAAESFMNVFSDYSDSPVNVELRGNAYQTQQYIHLNLNRDVTPHTSVAGQHVHSGSGPGGDYQINVPTTAKWNDDRNNTMAIITTRGMFQGAEPIHLQGRGKLPDRIVVNIEPTVPATDAKNYPLTSPTREHMKAPFNTVITRAVQDHLMKAAKAAQEADIQAAFDALVPAPNPRNPAKTLGFVVNDRGGRYTPDELNNFQGNPRVQAIAGEMKKMLDRLDGLFPTEQTSKTIKFGFDLADLKKGGVNIPNISNTAENAIMVNLPSAILSAGPDPQVAADRIAHLILHEFNHNIVREEGAGFTWQFAETDSRFGLKERANVAKNIFRIITTGDGKYAPDILQLLHEYTATRGRPDTKIDFIARQGEGRFIESPEQGGVPVSDRVVGGEVIDEERNDIKNLLSKFVTDEKGSVNHVGLGQRVKQATGWGQGISGGKQEFNWLKEALAVPSAITTTGDFSPPGRQGLSQILTPQFWQATYKMFGGLSEKGFKQIDDALHDVPIMQRPYDEMTGKFGNSKAQEMGLKVFRPASEGKMGKRAEATASRWLEVGIGKGIGSQIWKNTAGIPIRAANRVYITFLNHLNVNRAQYLMDLAQNMSLEALTTGKAQTGIMPWKQKFTPEQAMDLNPYHNTVLAKEIGDFMNTATGHGPLKMHVLPWKKAEVSLEGAAGVLSSVMFSPGLFMSRMRMMNPNTYVMASPMVRKQYVKAALSTGLAWYAFAELLKNAGGDEASVNTDWTSADFGKVRIGNTRLDPGGGFAQFAVMLGRLIEGGYTSSATGQFHEFGAGFQAETQLSNALRFASNKLNPVVKFAWDMANQSQYQPLHVGDRALQMFVPLFYQDLYEMWQKDPELLGFMTPVMFGMGTQTYGKGESAWRFIPPEQDWLAGGGGLRDLIPGETENYGY